MRVDIRDVGHPGFIWRIDAELALQVIGTTTAGRPHQELDPLYC